MDYHLHMSYRTKNINNTKKKLKIGSILDKTTSRLMVCSFVLNLRR